MAAHPGDRLVAERSRQRAAQMGIAHQEVGHPRGLANLEHRHAAMHLVWIALSPRSGEQFVQGVHDAVTLWDQGSYKFAQFLVWNRHNFQRMQNDVNILDLEGRIESQVAYFSERGLSNQWHYNSTTITVVQRRLHQHHIGNIFPMLSRIPMDIELSHGCGSK